MFENVFFLENWFFSDLHNFMGFMKIIFKKVNPWALSCTEVQKTASTL